MQICHFRKYVIFFVITGSERHLNFSIYISFVYRYTFAIFIVIDNIVLHTHCVTYCSILSSRYNQWLNIDRNKVERACQGNFSTRAKRVALKN